MHNALYRCAITIPLLLMMIGLPQQVKAQSGGQERPSLPDEQTYATSRFIIHFTLEGEAAVDPQDTNDNGVPDYVEQVAEAVEYSWSVEIDQMGWAVPPSDSGEGGDRRFDVYLENLMPDGIAGYAQSDGGLVRDNPNTPELERRASYSYLSLDNDYAELDASSGETPFDLLRATVAHEFNHVIQAGYDDFDPQHWVYEATATWMETQVYPDTNDNALYLYDIYASPDICRISENGWYGSWLFLELMSERYGRDIVRTIWEQSRQLDGFESIDRVLAMQGSSLVQESRDFAIANLLRAYQKGASYPSPALEGQIDTGIYTPPDGVMSLGADYVQLTGSGSLNVSLNPIETGSLSGSVVGIKGGRADVFPLADTVVINADRYDDTYIVVNNDEISSQEQDCTYRDYTLTVSPMNQAETSAASTWPAGKFVALESGDSTTFTTGASDSEHNSSYHPPFAGSESQSSNHPQDLNVEFTFIVPDDLPTGYNFDYAYVMTADDLGTNADYYMPGGDKTANLDYLNSDGNWLSISQSPSPYQTVREWMTDIGYTDSPGTFEEIRGLRVLVEDLSTDTEPWFSATFITNGLFVVVDGNHSREEVLSLVADVIDSGGKLPVNTGGTQSAPPDLSATGPTPEPAASTAGNRDVLFAAAFGLCGLGICIAGLAVVVGVAIMFRRRRG